mmetsp:Transcript_26229/g.57958  ORF Transcript_26229/g.57958 Transcript_26229/m.57958 type:complete len:147 (+) Transcript_26229:67-507(+)
MRVLSFAAAVATAEIWSDCTAPEDIATITKVAITPDPPTRGTPLTIELDLNLKEPLESGSINVDIKYDGIVPLKETLDLCKELAQTTNPCPLAAGPVSFSFSATIPKVVPEGKVKGTAKVVRAADSKEAACVGLDFSLKGDEGVVV